MTRRDLYLLLVVAVFVNSLLWLDSFDRYLNSRYHFYLAQYLPDAAFAPSRALQDLMNFDGAGAEVASANDTDRSGKAGTLVAQAPVQQPVVALQAASGVQSGAQSGALAQAASAPEANAHPERQLASAAQQQPASAPVAGEHPDQQTGALPDAHPKVLFAGDSMMQGVAPFVISRMRREYPQGVFVDLSKPSTGLTVKRYFDWPAKIKDESIKQAFQIVVIFLGPNDPWDIYEGKKRYAFPSDNWEQKYRDRVDEVLNFAASRGIRVIWVGLPVMREERIELGAKIENRIFQEETRKFKFDYLSTEDFLGSVDEPYKKYIEDPKKGKLVVRADDGIHFTSLGLRMISSRVEDLIRKLEKS